MKLTRRFSALICLMFLFFVGTIAAARPIKTLLITGQNNHNWKVSHIALKNILEESEHFSVDFAIAPSKGENMESFVLDFTLYQLVVLDYNGDAWPEQTNKNFLNYVQQGGGVVVYHAADNAFVNWPEYNKIIALGGWNGRNETAGPWVYWADGKLKKDSAPGLGGSHGKQHEYTLTARNSNHPIMKGMPYTWKHAKDELYDRMRGPGNIKDVLYTAYSDKSIGGSGREELLIFTVDYADARIFHTMLGHAGPDLQNNPAMDCQGFKITLLRGAEWAATGKVKSKVPKTFKQ